MNEPINDCKIAEGPSIERQLYGMRAERDALRAEVARLRDAMVCACEVMSPQFAAHEVLTTALREGKEKE